MSHDREQRIGDALSSLVDTLIPVIDGEDDAVADERHDNALDLAKNLLERCESFYMRLHLLIKLTMHLKSCSSIRSRGC